MTPVTIEDIDYCLDVVHPGVERCAACPDNGTLVCVQRIRDEEEAGKSADETLGVQTRHQQHLSSCC
jgi:hypothetical protein